MRPAAVVYDCPLDSTQLGRRWADSVQPDICVIVTLQDRSAWPGQGRSRCARSTQCSPKPKVASIPTRVIGYYVHKPDLIAIAANPAGEQIGDPAGAAMSDLDAWASQHLSAQEALVLEMTTNALQVHETWRPTSHRPRTRHRHVARP